jgi:hypothetical protein
MDEPRDEPSGHPVSALPRWVKASLVVGLREGQVVSSRQDALRKFRFSLVGGLLQGLLLLLASLIPGSDPYMWLWLVGLYFLPVGALVACQWAAIRWLDRAGRWPS